MLNLAAIQLFSHRILLFFILLIVILSEVLVASPSPVFTNLTTREGLSSNITNSIVEDPYGFIWIGTQEGLNRYDGFRMTLFQQGNSTGSISNNNISVLLMDGEYIWVGTWDGLNKINIRTHVVSRINTGEARVIRALHLDHDGRLWIGTSRGLLIFDQNSGGFTYYHTGNSQLSHNTIRCFYQSADGNMWIGTYDGLNRFSNGEFTSYNLKGDYMPMLENNLIVSLHPYQTQNDSLLWVGTETGLALFNTQSGVYSLFNVSNTRMSNEVIKTIYPLNDSILWLGTDFGLNAFHIRTHEATTFYHDPLIDHTLASNVIWQIFEDSRNRLWLITSNGVSITEKREPFYSFHEQYFSTEPTRIGNQVKDILVASTGEIWLATIHGVVKKNADGITQKTFSTSSPPRERILLNNVYALMEDDRGRIWIGTAGGINIWDPKEERMFAITSNRENGLLSNYISGFTTDYLGNLWVTAWEGGVFRIVWDQGQPEGMKFELADPNGDGRLVTTPGQVFYGSNHGFWAIDPETLGRKALHKVNETMAGNQISSLAAGKDGSVWMGSMQQIIRYFPANDSISTIEIQTGRPQRIINLREDKVGNLWATTTDAIIRLNIISQLQTLIPIDKSAPMKGFYPYCSAITADGDILFGGDNGYIRINPHHLDIHEVKPEVFISGLFVNNQQVHPSDSIAFAGRDIAFTERLRLRHNQNSLTFEFSTLDYLFPDFVRFQYRLLPGQESWTVTSGEKNFAVFSNLRPGDYLFEVMGSDRFGNWSEARLLPVKIIPSIWFSRGFILLYIFVLVSGSWYAYRVYRNRRRLRNELQIIKIEQQHAEALYQSKIRFFTNISHEFRTPLTLILPPLQELLKENTSPEQRQKMLTLANRNARRLYKLVNQLLDFRKIEAEKLELIPSGIELVSFCKNIFDSFDDLAGRNETVYSFHSDMETLNIEADPEKLETIIFNLLSNAFKYTPVNGNISLVIRTKEKETGQQEVEIIVSDTGMGISPGEQGRIFEQFYQTEESKSMKRGSGIGLSLAREYARLHKGQIGVSSRVGEGSTFVVSLPVVFPPAMSEVMKESSDSMPRESSSAKQTVAPPSPENAKTILIVDDNEDILEFIDLNLNHTYHTLLARNGQQALKIIEQQHPGLVISDVMMPVMDGIELCSRIKQNKATMHIPVILLTARSLDMQKTEGMDTGADMYITKPFDIEYLQSCIRGIFRRGEQMESYIKTRLIMDPEQGHDAENNQKELFLKRLMALIENNLSNPDLSVEMLGSSMGMSATHLYRKLKETTGYSTKEIIMNYRMQKAAQMIENNEGNISEIMYAVGFSSLSGFSRGFKAKYGVSPTAYAGKN